MGFTTCFTLKKHVADVIERIPYGEKSAIVNEALEAYFEMNPDVKAERAPRKAIKYPEQELDVNEL